MSRNAPKTATSPAAASAPMRLIRRTPRRFGPRARRWSASGSDLGSLEPSALEFRRGSLRRVSSPLVGEDQGGGSRRPTGQASSDAFDNLAGRRDPPPPPAPARGGGCANAIDSTEMQQALVGWVECHGNTCAGREGPA